MDSWDIVNTDPQKREVKTPYHTPRTQTDATLSLSILGSSNFSHSDSPPQQSNIRRSRLILRGPDSVTKAFWHLGCFPWTMGRKPFSYEIQNKASSPPHLLHPRTSTTNCTAHLMNPGITSPHRTDPAVLQHVVGPH